MGYPASPGRSSLPDRLSASAFQSAGVGVPRGAGGVGGFGGLAVAVPPPVPSREVSPIFSTPLPQPTRPVTPVSSAAPNNARRWTPCPPDTCLANGCRPDAWPPLPVTSPPSTCASFRTPAMVPPVLCYSPRRHLRGVRG